MTKPSPNILYPIGISLVVLLCVATTYKQTFFSRRIALLKEPLSAKLELLKPLHTPVVEHRLEFPFAHSIDPRQSYQRYMRDAPSPQAIEFRKIYLQPLGTISSTQPLLLSLSSDFLQRYYCVDTEMLPTLDLPSSSGTAKRFHIPRDITRSRYQYHIGHINSQLLLPAKPKDAAALIGIVDSDLWSTRKQNYSFSESDYEKKVGVISTYRLRKEPASDPQNESLSLLRTLQIVAHEAGHMLQLSHCNRYRCNMGSAHSVEEADHLSPHLCPNCLQKILWLTGCNPEERFNSLTEFYEKHGFHDEAAFTFRSQQIIAESHPPPVELGSKLED